MQRQKLIVVELPFEPLASKNSYRTKGGRFIKSRVRRWMRDCGTLVKASMMRARITSWEPPIRIECDWYFPQHRGQREDPSNWYPALLDGIKGVLVDDAHIRLTDGRVERVAPADAKIVLTISEEPAIRPKRLTADESEALRAAWEKHHKGPGGQAVATVEEEGRT